MLTYGPEPSSAREIVRPFRPVAWVYAQLSREGTDERALQWRTIAEQLERDGASAAAIDALHEPVVRSAVAPATLAAFADQDGVLLHSRHLPDSDIGVRAGCTSPPDVVALLAHEQDRPPFVHVVIDRTGADIIDSTGGEHATHHSVIAGADDEIERNAPGGWSQARYQRRAEDSWQHNAHQVADHVRRRLAAVGAQVLVVSGDVRAVQLLLERVHEEPHLLVRHLSGSRSPDGSQTDRPGRLDEVLREVGREQTARLLETFQAHLDADGLSVQGAEDTVDALAAGRVATLLVAADAPERALWFGEGGPAVFRDHDSAVLLSSEPVESAPLRHVAVRSALLTGARVRVLPAGVPGAPATGIGALCRFAAHSAGTVVG